MTKMSREHRAKQFMPFAALKGYDEALRAQEKVVEPRKELPEEYQDELNWRLSQLQEGDVASITFYCDRRYQTVSGEIVGIDKNFAVLQVGYSIVPIKDIYEIVTIF